MKYECSYSRSPILPIHFACCWRVRLYACARVRSTYRRTNAHRSRSSRRVDSPRCCPGRDCAVADALDSAWLLGKSESQGKHTTKNTQKLNFLSRKINRHLTNWTKTSPRSMWTFSTFRARSTFRVYADVQRAFCYWAFILYCCHHISAFYRKWQSLPTWALKTWCCQCLWKFFMLVSCFYPRKFTGRLTMYLH